MGTVGRTQNSTVRQGKGVLRSLHTEELPGGCRGEVWGDAHSSFLSPEMTQQNKTATRERCDNLAEKGRLLQGGDIRKSVLQVSCAGRIFINISLNAETV